MGSSKSFLSQKLWKILNPNDWPIRIADLPPGSALVGGSVRDGLLNRLNQFPDLDFVVPVNAIQLTKYLSLKVKGTFINLDEERDIARLVVNGWTLDFAGQVGETLEDDLWRRDFRINAIALKLGEEPKLVDPTGGLDDLISQKIVAISEKNLTDDPLRILRGLRLMCELDFGLEKETKNFLKTNSIALNRVSPERIKMEILKIINSNWGKSVWPTFLELQLLKEWQCEEKHLMPIVLQDDGLKNSSEESSIGKPLARLVCLLSDQGLERLNFSKNQIRRCRKLRFWVCKINKFGLEDLSEDERFQLHIDLVEDLPSFILFLESNYADEWLKRWKDISDPLFHPSSPLDGTFLQKALRIPPGPLLGGLMTYLAKEKAFGRIFTNEEACEVARNWTLQNPPLL